MGQIAASLPHYKYEHCHGQDPLPPATLAHHCLFQHLPYSHSNHQDAHHSKTLLIMDISKHNVSRKNSPKFPSSYYEEYKGAG
jgi:hypothetical protein